MYQVSAQSETLCRSTRQKIKQAARLAVQIYAKTQFLVLSIGYSYYYYYFLYLLNYNLFTIFIYASFGRNVLCIAAYYIIFLLLTSSQRSLGLLVKVEKKSEIVIS